MPNRLDETSTEKGPMPKRLYETDAGDGPMPGKWNRGKGGGGGETNPYKRFYLTGIGLLSHITGFYSYMTTHAARE